MTTTDRQRNLNDLYDDYTKKYGLLCSRGNSLAFSDDSSYFLLCSLEVLDEEGNFKRKADMFTKRTIRPHVAVNTVDTASESWRFYYFTFFMFLYMMLIIDAGNSKC